jgi:hypothetical protein
MADPAVLDQERAVAREAGAEDRARIERPDVPKMPALIWISTREEGPTAS